MYAGFSPVNRFRKGLGVEGRSRVDRGVKYYDSSSTDSGTDGIFPTMRGPPPLFPLPFFATRKRRDRNDGRVASERTGQRINTRAR